MVQKNLDSYKIKDISHAISIIGLLLKKKIMNKEDIINELKIKENVLDGILSYLEYLGVIRQNNNIQLTSQAHSIFLEPYIVHEEYENYIKYIIKNKVRLDDGFKIPALLTPFLLIRSFYPYVGLIIKDMEKNENIKLSKKKKEFINEYFNPFKFNYNQIIKKWGTMNFSSSEFYSIWFELNKFLNTLIITDSKYELKDVDKQKSIIHDVDDDKTQIKIKEISTKYEDKYEEKHYNIPEEVLKSFFKIDDEPLTIRYYKNELYEGKLMKIYDIEMNLDVFISYIKKQFKTGGTLKINIYDTLIEWSYSDSRGRLPTIILKNDGIYIDENEKLFFSMKKIIYQIDYIKNIITESDTIV